MGRLVIAALVYSLLFLICVAPAESQVRYEIEYNPAKKGVSITTAERGKVYFTVYLGEGEKVWVQIVGYMASDLPMEIKHFKYEGTGAVDAWKMPASHKVRRFEVNVWRNKYQFGEGPDPQNEAADELLTEYYFTGSVDRDSAHVR